MYKQNLALNILQMLICHKPNQSTICMQSNDYNYQTEIFYSKPRKSFEIISIRQEYLKPYNCT